MKSKSILVVVMIVLFGVGYAGAGTWTTIDFPSGMTNTYPYGIDGDNIVGNYVPFGGGSHGFLYTVP